MKFPRKVYAIRHNATNRVYIGSSCHVDKRFYEHLSALKAHRHPVGDMQEDFDKYGDDFTLTVLDHIASISEKDKEYEWMDKNQSYIRGVGYNYKDKKWCIADKEDDDLFKKSEKILTNNEEELISLIRDSENPGTALVKAAAIITGFLCHTEVIFDASPNRVTLHTM